MRKYTSYEEKIAQQKIYSLNDIDQSLTYSYSHYLNWLFDDRVELIKGKIFPMSPAPSRIHQEVLLKILRPMANFLDNHQCKVYVAPFDVRFPKESKADKDVYTVLQPDICVICDPTKLDDLGCIGAPDLIVEILSPGNHKKELLYKYKIYEEFGVKEYWVVSTTDETILKYTLGEGGKFWPSKLFELHETVSSIVLPGFLLSIADIFED